MNAGDTNKGKAPPSIDRLPDTCTGATRINGPTVEYYVRDGNGEMRIEETHSVNGGLATVLALILVAICAVGVFALLARWL